MRNRPTQHEFVNPPIYQCLLKLTREPSPPPCLFFRDDLRLFLRLRKSRKSHNYDFEPNAVVIVIVILFNTITIPFCGVSLRKNQVLQPTNMGEACGTVQTKFERTLKPLIYECVMIGGFSSIRRPQRS